MSLIDSFQRRRDLRDDAAQEDRLIWAWRQAAEGAGLCRVVQTVTGPTTVTPAVINGTLRPLVSLVVALLPGMLVRDVREVAARLAPALGAVALRIEPVGLAYCRVTLLQEDPLAEVLGLAIPTGPDIILGRDDGGDLVSVNLHRDPWHLAVQGATRSGKSVLTYGVLAQAVTDPAVTVCGVDPTGLLFRPFVGTRHAEWQTSGARDPEAVERLLRRLVEEMDDRIAAMPTGQDSVTTSPALPLRLVVLEELAGLYRIVDQDRDRGKRVRALLARLLAEGAKAGYRVVLLVQRAEAAVLGSFERDQCSVRLTFRVGAPASVELLHPGVPADMAVQHTAALPGIALASVPGRDLVRMRAPYLGGYADYSDAVIRWT